MVCLRVRLRKRDDPHEEGSLGVKNEGMKEVQKLVNNDIK